MTRDSVYARVAGVVHHPIGVVVRLHIGRARTPRAASLSDFEALQLARWLLPDQLLLVLRDLVAKDAGNA